MPGKFPDINYPEFTSTEIFQLLAKKA